MEDKLGQIKGLPTGNEFLHPMALLAGIRCLMGYVGDGSNETVTLFQDDATRDYFIKVGAKSYHGSTLSEAVKKAVADI